ncbi:hypothetical protein ACM66Z_05545 [Sulfurovum sp. ST-21]|uniref:Uncharacterized protein n=1 Tax=Sulfurovum indicum TaxID=2779528 RepID=A0A7M1S861_9BACT|nr:hypothetical protein [Sulfurovum indicum]QOR62919.1 hypothetical protein IMZ28_05505 [Sulfurovum indicum]
MKIGSLLTLFSVLTTLALYAETNAAPKSGIKQKESNTSKSERLKKQLKEQMEREKKYAREQKFYQGDAYDLKSHEVDPNSLPDVPVIEPDYDFDITDVYRDDI